jgi:opacity protein-like surface antigen
VAGIPAGAHADGLLTPYLGAAFGGSTVGAPRLAVGGSIAFVGGGMFGLELDFSHSPDFFPEDHPEEQNVSGNLSTFMANVVVAAPDGGRRDSGLRLYGAGGLGVMRVRVEDPDDLFEFRSNDLALNVGGGVIAFLSDSVGIRGDLRYFRKIDDFEIDDEFDLDLSGFDFWRATAGVTLRF